MSWYYTYYLGYKKDDKIYPLGPYDYKGKLHEIFYKSRSFASDLHEEFCHIPGRYISEELRKEFAYEDYKGEECFDIEYLPLKDLPTGDGIFRGYCLEKDIEAYLNDEEGDLDWPIELKYEMLTPAAFAAKAKQELMYGVPKPEKDCDGEEIPIYSCKEYAFFSFMDYDSEEYEANLLRQAAAPYWNDCEKDGAEIVVLLHQG